MRFCRFLREGQAQYGRIEGEEVLPLTDAPWASFRQAGPAVPLASVELLVPAAASKVVCVGRNYRDHAKEMSNPVPEEPLLFLKPPTALNPNGRPIRLPPDSLEVHHEAELGLVIGRTLSCASEQEAREGIFALTCFNDVTARDIQRRESQFTRAKGYDTFACAGPWMITGLSPENLRVWCRVNGKVRQEGRTLDMVFSPARLVAFMSQVMTLLPGDIIATGTPAGVGALVSGDVVEVEVEGIGTLRNPVEGGA